jgi:hypothetical protein
VCANNASITFTSAAHIHGRSGSLTGNTEKGNEGPVKGLEVLRHLFAKQADAKNRICNDFPWSD